MPWRTDRSALLDLLGELKLTDVADRIRVASETLYHELIDAEVTAFIGAAPFERTTQRSTHRLRVLTTTAGDLDLANPKLWAGTFFPALLERRRRVDQALFAVVTEAHLHGVSTRKGDDLVKALGADSAISKSEVSCICAGLVAEVAQFRVRPLLALADLANERLPLPESGHLVGLWHMGSDQKEIGHGECGIASDARFRRSQSPD